MNSKMVVLDKDNQGDCFITFNAGGGFNKNGFPVVQIDSANITDYSPYADGTKHTLRLGVVAGKTLRRVLADATGINGWIGEIKSIRFIDDDDSANNQTYSLGGDKDKTESAEGGKFINWTGL